MDTHLKDDEIYIEQLDKIGEGILDDKIDIIKDDNLIYILSDDNIYLYLFKYLSAVILTIILPGLGHLIIRQHKKAIYIMIVNTMVRIIVSMLYIIADYVKIKLGYVYIFIYLIAILISVLVVGLTSDCLYDIKLLMHRLRYGYPIHKDEFMIDMTIVMISLGYFKNYFLTYRPHNAPKEWLSISHYKDNNSV